MIPHTLKQLSPSTSTTEPVLYSRPAATTEACVHARASGLQQEKSLQWEASSPQPENAHEQQQRCSAAKNKLI